MRADHVIWATADLDAAAERMEREHSLAACAAGHLRAYDLALRHAAGRRRR